MALLTFPLIDPSVAPQVGASRVIHTATSIARTQAGRERRRVLATIPAEELLAFWAPRDDSRWVAEQLASFFRQTGGPARAFVAYDFDYSFQHSRIYVGTGDGTTTVFQLPCRDTASSVTLYKDGAEVTSGVTLAAGDNDREKATFSVAPAAGVVVTASFVGQRAWVCRFGDDSLALETGDAGSYGIAVRLVETRDE